jgi:hypothetical protein
MESADLLGDRTGVRAVRLTCWMRAYLRGRLAVGSEQIGGSGGVPQYTPVAAPAPSRAVTQLSFMMPSGSSPSRPFGVSDSTRSDQGQRG